MFTSLASAKSLPSTKSLAFTKLLVIDQLLIDENLSNMTEMSSSNNLVIGNYSSGNIERVLKERVTICNLV